MELEKTKKALQGLEEEITALNGVNLDNQKVIEDLLAEKALVLEVVRNLGI